MRKKRKAGKRMSNWDKLKEKLVNMTASYFRNEGEQEEIYGRTFFEAITADPAYKEQAVYPAESDRKCSRRISPPLSRQRSGCHWTPRMGRES